MDIANLQLNVQSQNALNQLNKVEKSLSKINTTATDLTKVFAGLWTGKKLVQFFNAANNAYNKLLTTNRLFGRQFSGALNQANREVTRLRNNFQLTENQAKRLMNTIGGRVGGFGFSSSDTAQMSSQIAGIANEIAASLNISVTDEFVNKLTNGIFGATKGLREFGIVLNTQSAEYKKQVQDLMIAKGLTEDQAKAYLNIQEIQRQSEKYAGGFLATGNLRKELENISNIWNDEILPKFGAIFEVLAPIATYLRKALEQGIVQWILVFASIKIVLGVISSVIGMIYDKSLKNLGLSKEELLYMNKKERALKITEAELKNVYALQNKMLTRNAQEAAKFLLNLQRSTKEANDLVRTLFLMGFDQANMVRSSGKFSTPIKGRGVNAWTLGLMNQFYAPWIMGGKGLTPKMQEAMLRKIIGSNSGDRRFALNKGGGLALADYRKIMMPLMQSGGLPGTQNFSKNQQNKFVADAVISGFFSQLLVSLNALLPSFATPFVYPILMSIQSAIVSSPLLRTITSKMIEIFSEIGKGFTNGIAKGTTSSAANAAGKSAGQAVGGFIATLGASLANKKWVMGIWKGVKAVFKWLWTAILWILKSLWGMISGAFAAIVGFVKGLAAALSASIGTAIAVVVGIIVALTIVVDWIQSLFRTGSWTEGSFIAKWFEKLFENDNAKAEAERQKALDKAKDLNQKIKESIKKFYEIFANIQLFDAPEIVKQRALAQRLGADYEKDLANLQKQANAIRSKRKELEENKWAGPGAAEQREKAKQDFLAMMKAYEESAKDFQEKYADFLKAIDESAKAELDLLNDSIDKLSRYEKDLIEWSADKGTMKGLDDSLQIALTSLERYRNEFAKLKFDKNLSPQARYDIQKKYLEGERAKILEVGKARMAILEREREAIKELWNSVTEWMKYLLEFRSDRVNSIVVGTEAGAEFAASNLRTVQVPLVSEMLSASDQAILDANRETTEQLKKNHTELMDLLKGWARMTSSQLDKSIVFNSYSIR